MTNHEIWRSNYRAKRYMEFLDKGQLEQRAKDILTNLPVLTADEKIGLRPIDNVGIYWMVVFTELLEEFRLRYGNYPNGFESGFAKEANVPRPENIKQTKQAIDKIGGIKEKSIYKYGKLTYMKDMIEFGKIRISPASYYNDSSLNYAIHDDELNFEISRLSEDMKLWNETKNCEIKPIGSIKRKSSLNTNYYVQCLSTAYSFREFSDFECDACVVIFDVQKFLTLVDYEVQKQIKDYLFVPQSVEYIDPLKPHKEPDVFFSKHFKFTYQNEFRLIWIPENPLMELEPFFIEIGDMSEYAKLIVLEND